MASGFIGKIDPFDNSEESWPSYIERAEQFFLVNDIANEKKAPILLTTMGSKTYSLLRSLVSPAKPAEKSYSDIVKILQAHLNPAPLKIAERFRFLQRMQEEGETIGQYIACLQKMTEYCDYGTMLNQMLRDKLIHGLHKSHRNIQQKLLGEADITFSKACETALAMETASKGCQEWAKEHTGSGTVNKLDRNSKGKSDQVCWRCNKSGHRPDRCWHRNAVCHQCGVHGHLKSTCKSSKIRADSTHNAGNLPGKAKGAKRRLHTRKGRNVKLLTDDFGYHEPTDDSDNELPIKRLQGKSSDIIWLTPKVEGVDLKMELDTGSCISVISQEDYKDNFSHIPLRKSDELLKTFTGEKISPLGVIPVHVEYNGQCKTLQLYVVTHKSQPLFGRAWLEHIVLDWPQIKTLESKSRGERLQALINKFEVLFQDDKMGTMNKIKARLQVVETEPKFFKPRPVPYSLKLDIERELNRLVEEEILSPVEHSSWATPIVPVRKRDGSLRICGDFKVTVNPHLNIDVYPLPKIEDLFANLAGGKCFTTIDLAHAYQQMLVEEDSRKYLVINTHKGLFRYNRLPFGVSSAPALFQKAIEQVLQGLPGVQAYLDDILVTGKNDDEHLMNLEQVFMRLKDYGLKIKKKKCEFFKESVHYLGHVINSDGLHTSKEKVNAILAAPVPTNLQQLRSFLGLLNYYGRFLPMLSTVIQPLNHLLSKDTTWKWTPNCDYAFKQAKELLASSNVLIHYDLDLPITLAADASSYGIGAVISHTLPSGEERPIAFASRSLSKCEQNYSQVEKEALSLIFGIKKFYQYLFGRRFTLITDHKPLTTILGPKNAIPILTAARLQRWALFLTGFNYDIQYKSTAKHGNADG